MPCVINSLQSSACGSYASGEGMKTEDSGWVLVGKNNYEHVLPPTMIFLGREECDVTLMSQSVDKRHAVITYDHFQHRFKVKDLNSANGTYVNNTRIPEQTYVKLNHMDTLRFGYDPSSYFIKEPQKKPVAKDISSPNIRSPAQSPTGNNSTTCRGCLHEMLNKQESDKIDIPDDDVFVPGTMPLHITEENLKVAVGGDDLVARRSKSDDKSSDSLESDVNALRCCDAKADKECRSSKSFSQPVQGISDAFQTADGKQMERSGVGVTETMNSANGDDNDSNSVVGVNPSTSVTTSPSVTSNHSNVVSMYSASSPPKHSTVLSVPVSIVRNSDPVCPTAPAMPPEYSQNSSAIVGSFATPQSVHPKLNRNSIDLMSASYPSPAFANLAAPSTIMHHRVSPVSRHHVVPDGYSQPYMNLYRQTGIYPCPNYPLMDQNILQSSPDLAAYNNMYPVVLQPSRVSLHWSGSNHMNGVNVSSAEPNSVSTVSRDSLEPQVVVVVSNSTDSNASRPSDMVAIKTQSTKSTKSTPSDVEGQKTPLYGQPSWWGEPDTNGTATVTESDKMIGAAPSVSTNGTSTPVATAFTIDFDAPKGSLPNKKLAIKDRISKYAPPKTNNDDVRTHRRSSSQTAITADDSTLPSKEDFRKNTRSLAPKCASKSTSNFVKSSSETSANTDHGANTPVKLDGTFKKPRTSDKISNKKADSGASSEPYPFPAPIKESTAFLIEKMFSSDGTNSDTSPKRQGRGSPDDRIRRRTVVLSPKEESPIDRKKTNDLKTPTEENDFPDNVSDCGTYTLDADKPNPEADAARNNIERAFGVAEGKKSSVVGETLIEEDSGEPNSLGNVACKKAIFEVTKPPVPPPRVRHKGSVPSEKRTESPPLALSINEIPTRHRRKLPTPPIDQSPLSFKSSGFSPNWEQDVPDGSFKSNAAITNGDSCYDTKKILKDTENVVTAMQARMRGKHVGHRSPLLTRMESSSSDSEMDVSSASLASDSALISRQKKLSRSAGSKSYVSDDASRRHSVTSLSNHASSNRRPLSAGVNSMRYERSNSAMSNSSESSDSSKKRKPPAYDQPLKFNRAFELRKAKVDDRPKAKSQPKSRPGSAGSSQSIRSSNSSSRLTPDSFNRSDGGRFSLRVRGAPPAKPKGPTKKDLELAAWNRRKAYNPMKAAAEGKKKISSKTDESFYTDDELVIPPLPCQQSNVRVYSPTNRNSTQRLEALDILVISSILQLSCKLRQKSQQIISKITDNCDDADEVSRLEEILSQLQLAESPTGNSSRELSMILKNLKRIEIALSALTKASCLNLVPKDY